MGKKKGEAETMEKFSELQYVRPDMEKVLGDMRAVTEAQTLGSLKRRTWIM